MITDPRSVTVVVWRVAVMVVIAGSNLTTSVRIVKTVMISLSFVKIIVTVTTLIHGTVQESL